MLNICTNDHHFFHYKCHCLCVIIWIKCMERWMTCCHKNFTRRKNERKEGNNTREEEKEVIYFVNNASMLANWDGKTSNTMQINPKLKKLYNYLFFHFLCSWNMFKVWFLISNSTLIKNFILWLNQLHVNHKSCLSAYITMYHTKILKTLRFLCACC